MTMDQQFSVQPVLLQMVKMTSTDQTNCAKEKKNTPKNINSPSLHIYSQIYIY